MKNLSLASSEMTFYSVTATDIYKLKKRGLLSFKRPIDTLIEPLPAKQIIVFRVFSLVIACSLFAFIISRLYAFLSRYLLLVHGEYGGLVDYIVATFSEKPGVDSLLIIFLFWLFPKTGLILTNFFAFI